MEHQIVSIRDALLAQTKDRSKFFTVNNILEHYNMLKSTFDSLQGDQIRELQYTIDDSLLLFSLAFMTVGFQHLPVALFAKAFCLRSTLSLSIGELSITPKEAGTLSISIKSIEEGSSSEEGADVPDISLVSSEVKRQVAEAQKLIKTTKGVLNELPETEQPLFVQITHLRRDILATAVSATASKELFANLELKLEKIKAHLDTCSTYPDPSLVTRTQLLKTETFLRWFKNGVTVDEVKDNDPELVAVFERLQKILPVLDVLVMTRRWTLRSTDLYQYMASLTEMHPSILNFTRPLGSLETAKPHEISLDDKFKYKHLVKYMCRKAWVQIYKLLDSNEPVSEALSSIYNQLSTMKRCLLEVQNAGGISNMRELYPFQMKLTSLDALREDGKFVVDGEIPPGQGVVIGILAECFDIVYEMKIELDEKGEDEGDESLLVDDGEDEFSDVDEDEYQSSICADTDDIDDEDTHTVKSTASS